jgi:hypothetical protein
LTFSRNYKEEKVMKHKLTIGVSNKSPKSRVVTYKKVSPDAKVKDVIGDASKVTIIVPGDSVKSVTIEETKEGQYGK